MKLDKAKKLFGIKKGEQPTTKFIDNLSAVKVTMVDWPDEVRLKHVLVNFSTATWYKEFYLSDSDRDECDDAIKDLMEGNMLAQGIEHPHFAFRVEGLSLHGTHALVRSRIGICYLQESHAVKDLRHADVLVPRAFTKHHKLLERYLDWVVAGKEIYADMLDTGDIAITDARFCLPKTIPSWIYTSMSLATLLNIFGKRSDTQEEHPEMNAMIFQMRDLVVAKFPYMSKYFVSYCDTGRCLHNRKGHKANFIFKRDVKHEVAGYSDEWTMHDKTKQELMLDCDEFPGAYDDGTGFIKML